MRIAICLISLLLLSACQPPTDEPDPDLKANNPSDSAPVQTPVAPPGPAVAETTPEDELPEACLMANTPTIPNGAPCSNNFYADMYTQTCSAWREQCCSYEGVCN